MNKNSMTNLMALLISFQSAFSYAGSTSTIGSENGFAAKAAGKSTPKSNYEALSKSLKKSIQEMSVGSSVPLVKKTRILAQKTSKQSSPVTLERMDLATLNKIDIEYQKHLEEQNKMAESFKEKINELETYYKKRARNNFQVRRSGVKDVFGFSFRNYKFITTGENNENTLITFNVSFSVMGRDYVTDQFVYYVVYDVNKNFVTSETLGVHVDVGFNLVTRLKDGAQIAIIQTTKAPYFHIINLLDGSPYFINQTINNYYPIKSGTIKTLKNGNEVAVLLTNDPHHEADPYLVLDLTAEKMKFDQNQKMILEIESHPRSLVVNTQGVEAEEKAQNNSPAKYQNDFLPHGVYFRDFLKKKLLQIYNHFLPNEVKLEVSKLFNTKEIRNLAVIPREISNSILKPYFRINPKTQKEEGFVVVSMGFNIERNEPYYYEHDLTENKWQVIRTMRYLKVLRFNVDDFSGTLQEVFSLPAPAAENGAFYLENMQIKGVVTLGDGAEFFEFQNSDFVPNIHMKSIYIDINTGKAYQLPKELKSTIESSKDFSSLTLSDFMEIGDFFSKENKGLLTFSR